MASVTLSVKAEGSDTVDGAWFVIDDLDVTLVNGLGSIDVSADDDDHSFQYWFGGAPGGTLTYEIKQGSSSLAKGKSSISAGKRQGRGEGDFKITVPANFLLKTKSKPKAKAKPASKSKIKAIAKAAKK